MVRIYAQYSLPNIIHFSVDAVSRVTPREFEETYIRVYCRYRSQKDVLKDVFQQVS